jgi:vitamin K-dependent gamma-carboxylase
VRRLFEPVDIASLVYYRVAFGALMLWNVGFYYQRGFIARFWADPTFRFSFPGFAWIQPWPGDGLYLHFAALAALAVLVGIGCFYRAAITLLWLGWTYLFLLDQANYRNHFYLVCVMSFLMIFVPAHRAFSVDAWRRPSLRSATAAAWALWILRAQMGCVYFFGGLAKINQDWLHGEPMRTYLSARTDLPLVGRWLGEDWMAYAFSYGGLLFDLLVVPGLLWRRTRPLAFLAAVTFHLTNAVLFDIGVFPWFSIATTALFFPPDWPRRLLPRRFGRGAGVIARPHPADTVTVGERATVLFLAAFFAVQALLPLRRHLYPGNFLWTEEGYLFSWDMIVSAKGGIAVFEVTDPATGATWTVQPARFLTRTQLPMMIRRPSLVLQFAHFLADEWRRRGYERVEVRVRDRVSMNKRTPQWLIDPDVDLAAERLTLAHSHWITELTEPLPPAPGPR